MQTERAGVVQPEEKAALERPFCLSIYKRGLINVERNFLLEPVVTGQGATILNYKRVELVLLQGINLRL